MSFIQTIINKTFRSAELIHKEQITPTTYHIRIKISGDTLKNYIPGQQLRILVGLDNITSLTNLVRTYSIWYYDELTNEADLAICTFSNGQGANWVQNLDCGDTIYFRGPEGKFTLNPDADNHLFLGDISSLAHLYELNRHTGYNKTAAGIVYSSSRDHHFEDIYPKRNFGFLESCANTLEDLIAEISWSGIRKESTAVYIAGETSICVGLNNYFKKELNFSPKQIKTKPFWHPDKKGLE